MLGIYVYLLIRPLTIYILTYIRFQFLSLKLLTYIQFSFFINPFIILLPYSLTSINKENTILPLPCIITKYQEMRIISLHRKIYKLFRYT